MGSDLRRGWQASWAMHGVGVGGGMIVLLLCGSGVCVIFYVLRGSNTSIHQHYATTVGARIPNTFGIRMVQSRSVQAPTIRKPNLPSLGHFI